MNEKFLNMIEEEGLNSNQGEGTGQISDLRVKIEGIRDFLAIVDKRCSVEFLELKNALKSQKTNKRVEVRTSFSDITRSLLIWFFVFSFPIVAGSIYFGMSGYQEGKEREKRLVQTSEGAVTREQVQWLVDYAIYMREKNPKTTKKFVEKNPYPKVN